MAGGWWEYENNISDHRPVAIKFTGNDIALNVSEQNSQKTTVKVFPNPSNNTFSFAFNTFDKSAAIEIYTINGQLINHLNISNGKNLIIWNAMDFPKGIYYAKFIVGAKIEDVKKLVLIK